LDLGSFGVRLLLRILGLDFATDNKLAHVVLLGQIEKFANLARSLGTETFRVRDVGDSGDFLVTLLDDDDREDREIGADDAASDGFPLSFSGAAGSVARVAFGEKETDTGGVKDTILHGKALLVVAASDFEDVSFEFVANGVSGDFLANPLVHESAQPTLIFDFNELLTAIGRIGNVKLHYAELSC